MRMWKLKMMCYPRVVDYGKSATIYIDMGPGINGYVECYIDPYDPNWLPDTCDAKIPIVDGKANLTLTNLKLSKYVELADINNRVYFKFHYENPSREISCDAVILVNPKVPKMGTLKDTSMYLGTYKQIKVKVYGYDGKAKAGQKAYVKMNSEVFFVKTDSNGYASFNVLEKVGTYSITFYCCKNKDLKDYKLGWYDTVTYKSVKSNTIKLTVKHFLTLKSVTVKKSAKKLTLQATASIGSPIKNAKVTFKFNGKTYTKRTDSKGVAKITISKSVLSKLKVGKKITYQATCGEDTVKKTAIVKK